MKITMNDESIISMTQLEQFLKGVDGAVTFSSETRGNQNKQKMYDWVETVITRFRYFSLKKGERKLVIDYLKKMTGKSRSQVKKLIKQKKKFGRIKLSSLKRNTFFIRYGTSDVARLIETDNAHGRLSGPATKRILKRESEIFGKTLYENIAHISVPHIYNLRKKSRQYQSQVLFVAKTQAVDRNIGERRKPQPTGRPGFIRIDTVHQGDRDKEKGVYHINLVDEVTQWEIVGCVEGISEQFLLPLLEVLLSGFPFVILGFHSDNGSEYINQVTAKLLKKLLIDQTKSRSRRTNDNALVESKNGAVIRKHLGHVYIPKRYAQNINRFYRDHLSDYLNYHRPCGFATDYVDQKGKIKKIYDTYLTPYEKLISLPNFEKYLKPDISASSLKEISQKQSDNESAQKMQKAKLKLFN